MHVDWQEAFYPHDLPEDWRLAYYANAWSCVLVPADYPLTDDELADWLDDTPEDFHLYFELPRTSYSPEIQRIAAQAAGRVVFASGSSEQVIELENGKLIALLEINQLDLRDLRGELEKLREVENLCGVIASDSPPSPDKLDELKTLMELLGF